MTTDSSLIDELREHAESELAVAYLDALKGTLKPLAEHEAKLDADIAQREAELVELKRVRSVGQKIRNYLTPSAEKKTTSSKNGGKSSNAVAPETLKALEDWLRAHIKSDESFATRELIEHRDWNGWLSYPTTSAGLVQLADAGLIRLDRIGPRNQRNYKLVR